MSHHEMYANLIGASFAFVAFVAQVKLLTKLFQTSASVRHNFTVGNTFIQGPG